ncbi:MAG: hypothetical protein QOD74_2882, partial [Variibacter sp.]|nr:hypothetical protein [Variibacter sp.]
GKGRTCLFRLRQIEFTGRNRFNAVWRKQLAHFPKLAGIVRGNDDIAGELAIHDRPCTYPWIAGSCDNENLRTAATTTVVYALVMTQEQVKRILERVLTWPPHRQADAAELLTLMEAQDQSDLRLTDQQALEVRRRMRLSRGDNLDAEAVFDRLR